MPEPVNLFVSRHPAVLHKLALLRDERTEPKKFRELVREISWLVGYEALSRFLSGEIDKEAAVKAVADGWNELNEEIGVDEQLEFYRATIGAK